MGAPWIAFLLLILASHLPPSNQSSQSANNNFDGPAELPREYIKSSLKDTPAHGTTWTVRSGQSLEPVLANSSCGDVIQLQPGATFGTVVLPPNRRIPPHLIHIPPLTPPPTLPPPANP